MAPRHESQLFVLFYAHAKLSLPHSDTHTRSDTHAHTHCTWMQIRSCSSLWSTAESPQIQHQGQIQPHHITTERRGDAVKLPVPSVSARLSRLNSLIFLTHTFFSFSLRRSLLPKLLLFNHLNISALKIRICLNAITSSVIQEE